MRVYPISKNLNLYNVSNTRKIRHANALYTTDGTSFCGSVKWGGAIGSVVGTFAGIGIGALATIATGGLAAPLILGMAGAAVGGVGGDAIDSKIRKSYPHDEDTGNSDTSLDVEGMKWTNY
ncbi:hypothetical protein IKQ21_02820 [bacterium]|nr:hypothetical protein [bacterium]